MPEPDLRLSGSRLARALVLGGSILTLVGVVLPWVEVRVLFGRIVVDGLDTNPGRLSLAAAVFAAVLILVAPMSDEPRVRRVCSALCLFPGATIVFLAGFNLQDISRLESIGGRATAEVGPGLWVTLVAGLLVLAGAFVGVRVTEGEPMSEGPPPPFTLPGNWPPVRET